MIVIIALVAWTLTPTATATEFLDRFLQEQGGDQLRWLLQAAGRGLLAHTPQGIGFGGFRAAAAHGAISVGTLVLAHCHELFVQIGLDSGWLGLAGFVLLAAYAVLRGAWGAWTGQSSPYAVGFTGALLGVLLQGLNDYFFFETASVIAFALVVLGALAGNVESPLPVAEVSENAGQPTPHARRPTLSGPRTPRARGAHRG
jgi:hypothetical protein